jgi:hypothetical protein
LKPPSSKIDHQTVLNDKKKKQDEQDKKKKLKTKMKERKGDSKGKEMEADLEEEGEEQEEEEGEESEEGEEDEEERKKSGSQGFPTEMVNSVQTAAKEAAKVREDGKDKGKERAKVDFTPTKRKLFLETEQKQLMLRADWSESLHVVDTILQNESHLSTKGGGIKWSNLGKIPQEEVAGKFERKKPNLLIVVEEKEVSQMQKLGEIHIRDE